MIFNLEPSFLHILSNSNEIQHILQIFNPIFRFPWFFIYEILEWLIWNPPNSPSQRFVTGRSDILFPRQTQRFFLNCFFKLNVVPFLPNTNQSPPIAASTSSSQLIQFFKWTFIFPAFTLPAITSSTNDIFQFTFPSQGCSLVILPRGKLKVSYQYESRNDTLPTL